MKTAKPSEPSHYETLGVSPTASDDEISHAFVALIRKHGDKPGETDLAVIDCARQIRVAYDALGDPVTRAAYDSSQGIFFAQQAEQGATMHVLGTSQVQQHQDKDEVGGDTGDLLWTPMSETVIRSEEGHIGKEDEDHDRTKVAGSRRGRGNRAWWVAGGVACVLVLAGLVAIAQEISEWAVVAPPTVSVAAASEASAPSVVPVAASPPVPEDAFSEAPATSDVAVEIPPAVGAVSPSDAAPTALPSEAAIVPRVTPTPRPSAPEIRVAEAAPAASPSFNCRVAQSRSEQIVCNSQRLASLDRQMSAQFYAELTRGNRRIQAELRQSRDRFLAYRERCTDEMCTEQAYLDRMAEIEDIVSDR